MRFDPGRRFDCPIATTGNPTWGNRLQSVALATTPGAPGRPFSFVTVSRRTLSAASLKLAFIITDAFFTNHRSTTLTELQLPEQTAVARARIRYVGCTGSTTVAYGRRGSPYVNPDFEEVLK
jgi:hypothetical protein